MLAALLTTLVASAVDESKCAAVAPALRISCNTYNISFALNATTCSERGCCWDAHADPMRNSAPTCYYASPAVPITKVRPGAAADADAPAWRSCRLQLITSC